MVQPINQTFECKLYINTLLNHRSSGGNIPSSPQFRCLFRDLKIKICYEFDNRRRGNHYIHRHSACISLLPMCGICIYIYIYILIHCVYIIYMITQPRENNECNTAILFLCQWKIDAMSYIRFPSWCKLISSARHQHDAFSYNRIGFRCNGKPSNGGILRNPSISLQQRYEWNGSCCIKYIGLNILIFWSVDNITVLSWIIYAFHIYIYICICMHFAIFRITFIVHQSIVNWVIMV